MAGKTKVLSEDDRSAARLRAALAEAGALSLNVIGPPGVGRTAFLEQTLMRIPAHTRAAVLTGDIQNENDAIRLRRYGYPVRQIAGACHLDAGVVERHIDDWIKDGLELLLIESTGGLVGSANLDLGEDATVVVLSAAENEDKPLEYPDVFRKAELMILNKIDLLPRVAFRPEVARGHARGINPEIGIIETSCITGVGFDRWLEWLASRVQKKKAKAMMAVATYPL